MIWNKKSFIYLHPTFWFILILSIMTGMFYHLTNIFLIVSWHEMGHFFMAKYFNWDIRRITLWVFGGVMETEEHLNKPLNQQLLVTITGPLQHVFILILLLILQNQHLLMPELIDFALRYNFLILFFNLLPIWPLDGGKLLNISLNYFTPFKKAHERTVIFSVTCLVLFIGIMLVWEQAVLNLFVLFTFLLWENRLEWKQRLYVYQRFLLARMDRQGKSRQMMPLIFTSQTLLKDVFTEFYYHRFHPIFIRDRDVITNETDCLIYYYKQGNYDAKLDNIIKHRMK